MKKIYILFFIVSTLFGIPGLCQHPPKLYPAKVPGGFQFADAQTGIPVNKQVWVETGVFMNGYAKVYANGYWGFVNAWGKNVVPARFQSVRNFVNHYAAAMQNNKWGFIDEKGKTVIPFSYDIVYDFKENVTAAYKGRKWMLLDKKGRITRTLDIDVFYGFEKGIAKITQNGRHGLMNRDGDIISIEPAKNKTQNGAIAARPQGTNAEPCPDNIGFERGNFTNWECFTGDVKGVGTTNVITVSPSVPTPNRHVIYPATNPSDLDPYGLFPINPPDGSGFALKLGNNVNGAEAERVRYRITVPANAEDASITYRYAVVFQDPGHLRHQQPRFSAKLLDVETNKYLTCASYEYVADDTIPGFFNSPVDDTIKCKNWASVFINLSAYAGKTLILEFTTADCTLGAHWGYTYVDVGDCNITAAIEFECNPNIARLSGPPGFRIYKWWDEEYTRLLGAGKNINLNPAPPGNSIIHLEVIPFNGANCSDTLHVNAINISPQANAGPDQLVCSGDPVTIGTAAVAGNTYSWSPADFLSNPNSATPVSRATTTTTYILTVTKSLNGCIDYDTVTVNVNPKPVAVFDSGPGQCMNENNFSFINTTTGATGYEWFFGDDMTSSLQSPVHIYSAAGNYHVKLVATAANGCRDSIIHPVAVYSNPVVTTVDDASICQGNQIQLQATGAQTYQWAAAPSLSCTNCAAPLASPATTTTYTVTGTSNIGCKGFDTVTVTVFHPIEVAVIPGDEICKTETMKLSASGAVSYKWTPANSLNNDTIPNPTASPATTTQYRVIGFDGHGCFTDTGYITVVVNPVPTINLGPDLTLPTGTIHPINALTTNGPIISWNWNPAQDLTCDDCPEPIATIRNDISYTADIRNIYGCTASDTINIKTFCEGSQVFIPNAFSPDGDGINDILMVRARGIQVVKSFRIYSRWGELLFEKFNFPPNTPAFGWDGRIRGKTGAPEVYVYTAEVTCDNMQTYTYKGNTAILK